MTEIIAKSGATGYPLKARLGTVTHRIKVFREAVRLIDEMRRIFGVTGWTQYQGRDAEGRVCLSGCLDIAASYRRRKCTNHRIYVEASDLTRYTLRSVCNPNMSDAYDLITYNDAEGRTFKQVLDKVDAAFDTLKAMHTDLCNQQGDMLVRVSDLDEMTDHDLQEAGEPGGEPGGEPSG